jgi:hypothetical protein
LGGRHCRSSGELSFWTSATLGHLCNGERRVRPMTPPVYHVWSPDRFLSHSRATLRANTRTKARSAGELDFLATSSVSAVGQPSDRTVRRFVLKTSDEVRSVPPRARLFPDRPTRGCLTVEKRTRPNRMNHRTSNLSRINECLTKDRKIPIGRSLFISSYPMVMIDRNREFSIGISMNHFDIFR